MRRLLHFEKVDWNSTVWVNGERVCSHVGGYDPFSCPLPEADDALEIAVGVVDYTELNPGHWQPRGKQVRSAFTVPSGMMYTGSSGIWRKPEGNIFILLTRGEFYYFSRAHFRKARFLFHESRSEIPKDQEECQTPSNFVMLG